MTDKEKDELEALQRVAEMAARATIDLTSNLHSAYKEYMHGDIPRGAYEYIRERQGMLLQALYNAGYVERHPIFEYPIKPTLTTKADRRNLMQIACDLIAFHDGRQIDTFYTEEQFRKDYRTIESWLLNWKASENNKKIDELAKAWIEEVLSYVK